MMILAKIAEVLKLAKISGYGLTVLLNCPAGHSVHRMSGIKFISFNALNFIIWLDVTM